MCMLELSWQNSLLRQLLGKGSRCPQRVKGFSEGPQWQEGCPGVLGAGDGAGRLGTPRRISRSVVSRAGEAVERRRSAPVCVSLCAGPEESAGIARLFAKIRVWPDFSSRRGGWCQPQQWGSASAADRCAGSHGVQQPVPSFPAEIRHG